MSEQTVTRAEVVAALRGWRPGAAEVVAGCGIDPARGRFPDDAIERAAALWRVLHGDDPDGGSGIGCSGPSVGTEPVPEPRTRRVGRSVHPRSSGDELRTRAA